MKKVLLFMVLCCFSVILIGKNNDEKFKSIKIHYKSDLDDVFINYKDFNGEINKKFLNDFSEKIDVLSKDDVKVPKKKKKLKILKKLKSTIEKKGIKMSTSPYYKGHKYIEIPENNILVYFKDNNNVIDNNKNNFYYLKKGEYIIDNGTVKEVSKNKIQIIVKSEWKQVYIHYNIDFIGWSDLPGLGLNRFNGIHEIILPEGDIEFVLTNGNDKWMNLNNEAFNNFKINNKGAYIIEDGNLNKLSDKLINRNDKVGIYFKSNLDNTFLNYNLNKYGYFTPLEMIESEMKPNFKYISLPYVETLDFFITDQFGVRISETNFNINKPGLYIIENDKIKKQKFDNDILEIRNSNKNYNLKISTTSRRLIQEIDVKKVDNSRFEFNIGNSLSKTPIIIKTTNKNYQEATVFDSYGNEIRKINFYKTRGNRKQSGSFILNEGKYFLVMKRTYDISRFLNNIKKDFEDLVNVLTFTQTVYAEELLDGKIELLSYGGWQTNRTFYSEPQSNKSTVEISYNMWIDFLVKTKDIGEKLKVVNKASGVPYTVSKENTDTNYQGKYKFGIDLTGVGYERIIKDNGDISIDKSDPFVLEVYYDNQKISELEYDLVKEVRENTLCDIYSWNQPPDYYSYEYIGNTNYYKTKADQVFELKRYSNYTKRIYSGSQVFHQFYDGHWIDADFVDEISFTNDIKINDVELISPEITGSFDNNKVKISWNNIHIAECYKIYRNGVLINETENTNYIDSSFLNGLNSYYVTTCRNENESLNSNIFNINTSIFLEKNSTFTLNNDIIQIIVENIDFGEKKKTLIKNNKITKTIIYDNVGNTKQIDVYDDDENISDYMVYKRINISEVKVSIYKYSEHKEIGYWKESYDLQNRLIKKSYYLNSDHLRSYWIIEYNDNIIKRNYFDYNDIFLGCVEEELSSYNNIKRVNYYDSNLDILSYKTYEYDGNSIYKINVYNKLGEEIGKVQ